MMFPMVFLPPPPYLEAVYCFICGCRRVAVARYRMICLVLLTTGKTEGVLAVHKRTHTGEKPFACEYCPYKGIDKSSLNKHMRIHTGEKPYACDVCSYRTSDVGHLRRHYITHTGENRYRCAVCPYTARDLYLLTAHSWIHTGEKPFNCDKCNFSCTSVSTMKRHKEKHKEQMLCWKEQKREPFRNKTCYCTKY